MRVTLSACLSALRLNVKISHKISCPSSPLLIRRLSFDSQIPNCVSCGTHSASETCILHLSLRLRRPLAQPLPIRVSTPCIHNLHRVSQSNLYFPWSLLLILRAVSQSSLDPTTTVPSSVAPFSDEGRRRCSSNLLQNGTPTRERKDNAIDETGYLASSKLGALAGYPSYGYPDGVPSQLPAPSSTSNALISQESESNCILHDIC